MGIYRVWQRIRSRFEPASLLLVTVLSMAVIVADADRRLSPENRLEPFEIQAAALWSVDQPLPSMPSLQQVARMMAAPPYLP
ncbi:MAG: hypothetical protein JSS04_17570 [Proteobacteria bacterium]|nr:hypothetical protein [Pseudomonadota bacterium]